MKIFYNNLFFCAIILGQPPSGIQAQILKVPHHGSKYSSSLSYYNRVKPEVAVICVGSGNDFGHPSSETISNLQKIGAKIFRTDLDGTVVISTDGTTWSTSSPGKSSSTFTWSQPVYQSTKSPTPKPTAKAYNSFIAPVVTRPVSAAAPVYQPVSSAPCNCNGPDKNCKDFPSRSAAQSCFEYCKSQGYGDCFGLDRDKDGRVCESL